MYGSDAGQPVPSLYTKGLSPLYDIQSCILGLLYTCLDETKIGGETSKSKFFEF